MITIKGFNFLNSEIKVKYSNDYFEDIVSSRFVDYNTIISDFPQFHTSNIRYPLDVDVSVSFDNGVNYMKSNLSIIIENSS